MKRFLILFLLLVPGALLHAAPDGEQLYRDHCMVCHGVDGQGGVGVPLALKSFQETVDDHFLFNTIRYGRPGRVMPSFYYLSDAQVNALVDYIRHWNEGKRPQFPNTPVKGDPERGKELYAKHCAACHGENGQGGHGTGVTLSRPRDLPIIPPALNNEGFLRAASDQMIRETLRKGRKGTPMVSFPERGLSERDIDDIVAHIRSFEKEAGRRQVLKAESATLVVESPYSLEETVENIKEVITNNNFVFIRQQYLETGFVPPGEEDKRQVIIYFCNFNFLNKALAIDPRVGMFLPCRITVVEQDGVVKVMSINPMRLSRIFNNVELNDACHEMRDTYQSMLEDATL